jgi:hypothetical protein
MLIFKQNDINYVYIHIPKNGGKYIRNKIKKSNTKIFKSYWGVQNNFDLAHIPYILRNRFINPKIANNFIYFAYSRNPYDRIISAYLYKNNNNTKEDFKFFVKNILINYNFNSQFNSDIIHYYPQYLFVCDINKNVSNVKIEKLETVENPKKYNLKDYFDDEIISIINKIYEKDFKFFNYEMIKTIL